MKRSLNLCGLFIAYDTKVEVPSINVLKDRYKYILQTHKKKQQQKPYKLLKFPKNIVKK